MKCLSLRVCNSKYSFFWKLGGLVAYKLDGIIPESSSILNTKKKLCEHPQSHNAITPTNFATSIFVSPVSVHHSHCKASQAELASCAPHTIGAERASLLCGRFSRRHSRSCRRRSN